MREFTPSTFCRSTTRCIRPQSNKVDWQRTLKPINVSHPPLTVERHHLMKMVALLAVYDFFGAMSLGTSLMGLLQHALFLTVFQHSVLWDRRGSLGLDAANACLFNKHFACVAGAKAYGKLVLGALTASFIHLNLGSSLQLRAFNKESLAWIAFRWRYTNSRRTAF